MSDQDFHDFKKFASVPFLPMYSHYDNYLLF